MISLTTLTVTSYNRDLANVAWTIQSTSESLAGYTLSLYVSEAPSTDLGDYDLVASGISASDYSYNDTTTVSGLYSDNRTWYYLAVVEKTSTGETSTQPSSPAYLKINTLSRPYTEILRQKNLVLERFSARESLYFVKRRTWGTYCTNCWDTTLQRITVSNCPTCLGTGYVGGYFTPVTFNGMINPAPKYNEITMFGQFMPSDCLLYMTNFPVLTTQDVIVDAINRRWLVNDVRYLEFKGRVIEQQARLSKISIDDAIYTISIG